MISAAEALRLPGAQLTESQQAKFEELQTLIKEAVQNGQKNKIRIDELDLNVLAAMDWQLKKAGDSPEWLGQAGIVDKNTVVHYWLNLDPEQAAYGLLTETQVARLDRLDALITEAVHDNMSFKGCGGLKIDELDSAVLTVMTYRLKRLRWKPEWKGQLGRTGKHVVLYFLNLDAEDDARKEAEAASSHARSTAAIMENTFGQKT